MAPLFEYPRILIFLAERRLHRVFFKSSRALSFLVFWVGYNCIGPNTA
jgi:hypothetical protein